MTPSPRSLLPTAALLALCVAFFHGCSPRQEEPRRIELADPAPDPGALPPATSEPSNVAGESSSVVVDTIFHDGAKPCIYQPLPMSEWRVACGCENHKCVVAVLMEYQGKAVWSGNGVVVDKCFDQSLKHSLVLTCDHVIDWNKAPGMTSDKAQEMTIRIGAFRHSIQDSSLKCRTSEYAEFECSVVYRDTEHDMALLKCLSPCRLHSVAGLDLSGRPGFRHQVSIIPFGQPECSRGGYPPIRWGQSGSPVFMEDAKVFGILRGRRGCSYGAVWIGAKRIDAFLGGVDPSLFE